MPDLDELLIIGARWIGRAGWRWHEGMLALRRDGRPLRLRHIEDAGNAMQEFGWVPDHTDPATFGWMRELVRNSWGTHTIYARPEPPRGDVWTMCNGAPLVDEAGCEITGTSEADAFLAAWEAGPQAESLTRAPPVIEHLLERDVPTPNVWREPSDGSGTQCMSDMAFFANGRQKWTEEYEECTYVLYPLRKSGAPSTTCRPGPEPERTC